MPRILVALLAVALLVPAAASGKSPPFVGVWKGTVKAASGATTGVVVTVSAKLRSNNSGSIAYASPACAGRLAYLKQSGRVLTLRETIVKGSCPKGGAVVLMQMDYRTLWLEWHGLAGTPPVWTGYLTLGGR